MSFTDVNAHTKKIIVSKHEKSAGKFSVTTADRDIMDLEKNFSFDGSGSVLIAEKKNKIINKNAFVEEIESLRKNHKIEIRKNNKEIPEISENIKDTRIVEVPAINNEAMQMINALIHTQNHIVQELTEVFDKRLEKFDDIILDLIRCKTENERLKQKIDNLTRDNYKHKKEIESFKSVIPGIYIKKALDKTRF